MDGARLFSTVPSDRTKAQWAQTGTKEVPYKHEIKLHFGSDRALEQNAYRDGGVSFSEHTSNLPRHFPGQPTAGNLGWS